MSLRSNDTSETSMPYRLAAALLLTLCCLPTAWAQLVIGQTSGFTGAAAAGAKENTEGARLYFDQVNRRGGVAGQRIELVSLDDQFQPQLAADNARKLIADPRVLALFLNRGTPHTEAIRPLLEEARIALVAPSSGAMALHTPVHPWIFNVRAPYRTEATRLVLHLTSLGMTRILVAAVNDSFGGDCLVGVQQGFESAALQPLALKRFERDQPDVVSIAQEARQREAQTLAKAKGLKDVTPAMLEGFAAAKVMVEGLRRAGPHPTRQTVRDALEGLHRLDIGGLEVSFSPASHSGLRYSDLAIIDGQGAFRR